jgi:cyclopropane-fatty-acyl-phospholipid synthase
MAAREDLEFTYSLTDRIFRLSLGEPADLSGAKYDGDFSVSLEEAQRRKHCYVAEQVGIGPGRRILDLRCGWGPLLDFIRSQGGSGVGVTLSSAQAAACRRHGLDVHLHDAREVTSSGSGARCGQGRFVLQTMVFGRSMIPAERIDIRAPRGSDAWYLALLGRQVPGSWLPHGQEQIIRSAEPHFRLVSSMSGRLDYIETIRRWRKRFAEPSLKRRLSSSRFCRAGLRAPISGSRSRRASAATGSASSGSCWTTIGSCSRRSFAVWLTDSVACGRFGPGGVSSDWGRVTGSGPRAG